jgi:hypothetical protein
VRTVIEHIRVSEIIDKEQEIYPRLGDAFEALKWWLSHDPESGELIDDANWLFKQDGDHAHNIPTLVVIYTFDLNYVEINFVLVRIPPV